MSFPSPVPNVTITDANGNPIGEFDEIWLSTSTLVEEKRASLSGFRIQATRRGLTIEMVAQEWAEEHIYRKTVGRIAALQSAVGTQPQEGGPRKVPGIDDFRGFRILVFRVVETDTRVRAAMMAQVQRLIAMFPGWTFQLP